MASIAHASVVIFGPGILVGVLIWLTQKEKASFASGQGLQAAVYQLLGTLVVMVLWLLWGIFYALTFIPLMQNPEQFGLNGWVYVPDLIQKYGPCIGFLEKPLSISGKAFQHTFPAASVTALSISLA